MTDNVKSPTFRSIAAETGDFIDPEFRVDTADDVDQRCSLAEQAFDEYRATPSEIRALFLETIAEEILELGDSLLSRAHEETGLPLERLSGERARTITQIRLFADLVRSEQWRRVRIDKALPDREPTARPDLRLQHIPLGPVAAFGASNFPLAFSTAGGDTVSALAAGCPVIVKGHPAHAGTDQMVASAVLNSVKKAGMPHGTFGHLMGPGNDLGARLVADERIAAVAFTGSRQGGLALAKLAGARAFPIPFYAEMSSVNPVIVLPRALADRAIELADGFIDSLKLGAGQFCTNPGLLMVIEGAGLEDFEAAAAASLEAVQPEVMLTPEICANYKSSGDRLAGLHCVRELARSEEGNGRTTAAARLFTIDGASVIGNSAVLDEVFGASSLIVHCANREQMQAILHDIKGQLTATIHLAEGDEDEASQLLPILERKAGRILVNGWPTGVEVSHAMVHGGPFPATSDTRATSVGTLAIERFLRPVCYQSVPDGLLPPALQDNADIPCLLDGKLS